jgi:ABC-type transport system involved in cytochrome bd biosynthesis fused ATPase/permease subunit
MLRLSIKRNLRLVAMVATCILSLPHYNHLKLSFFGPSCLLILKLASITLSLLRIRLALSLRIRLLVALKIKSRESESKSKNSKESREEFRKAVAHSLSKRGTLLSVARQHHHATRSTSRDEGPTRSTSRDEHHFKSRKNPTRLSRRSARKSVGFKIFNKG